MPSRSLILEEFDVKLHSILGERCKELESPALAIGNYFDHIHIVCVLSKNIGFPESDKSPVLQLDEVPGSRIGGL